RDPFGLIRVGPAPPAPPQVWIDIGEGDRWRRDAEAVHRALDERGWAHEWHLYPGSHDGAYWGDHLWGYLPFYAAAFARNGVAVSAGAGEPGAAGRWPWRLRALPPPPSQGGGHSRDSARSPGPPGRGRSGAAPAAPATRGAGRAPGRAPGAGAGGGERRVAA